MPRNPFERFLFMLMMNTSMVLIMVTYRMYLGYGKIEPSLWIKIFCTVWVIAFLINQFIVQPLTMKIIIALENNHTLSPNTVQWLTVSLSMTAIMSFVGMTLRGNDFLLTAYLQSWILSFIVSTPSSDFIVGPLARKLLTAYQKKKNNEF